MQRTRATRRIVAAVLCLPALSSAWLMSPAQAKRAAPARVQPLVLDGVRYSAGSERTLDANGKPVGMAATLFAEDARTDKPLWKLPVYEVRFLKDLETDVQEVHVSAIEADAQRLIVRNERGLEFLVDPKTRSVRGLIRPKS